MELLLAALAAETAPEGQEGQLARLRARAAAHRQAQATVLAANPDQIPDAALRLRELSALRYGVDPILSAATLRLFAQRYPADLPQPRKQIRPAAPAGAPATSAAQSDMGTANQNSTASVADPAVPSTDTSTPAQEWLTLPRRVKLE